MKTWKKREGRDGQATASDDERVQSARPRIKGRLRLHERRENAERPAS